MRLMQIKAEGDYILTEFFGNNIPPYAILSHTWGSSDQEVTFRDFQDGTGKDKSGYSKIQFCGRRAALDGLKYFWVDTNCIDKSSSAELTEAINSMFRWYQKAVKCYVYLSDVSVNGSDPAADIWKPAFLQSRWFTRGWTFQELIAPAIVEFFSQEGEKLGDKQSLEKEVTKITGINALALQGHPLSNFSIADRMSWAAKRESTREEDNAYCLLGIFDVYMPLIYGEGKRRAFSRLNEEIIKASRDIGTSTSAAANAINISAVPIQKSYLDRAELVQWLQFHDPYTNHLAAQRKKQPHTGSWFLQGERYNQWQYGQIPLLWISGSPGSGKTVLCSTIIQDLLENSGRDVSKMMAYYYFDFSEAAKRSLDSFIRSLIVQLTVNMDTPQELSNLYTHSQAKKQEPSIEHLKEILRAILTKSTKAIIAVDALDECSEPEELVQFIEEMRIWKPTDLRLLVVSRQHFEGADALDELDPIHFSIQAEVANNDILTFVHEKLDKDVKLRHWPPNVKKKIETALVSKSSGMFRWVACQTDILKKCRTLQDVDTVLTKLPGTLEETYDRILDGISDAYKSEVRAILQWLVFSLRPLRLEEVAEIVAFDESYSAFDTNRRLLNPLEVLTMCSSLLVMNDTYYHDYNTGRGRIPITEVRLAHFTVKDYLLSQSIQQSRHSYYSIEQKSASLQIAKACLTYLNMDQFSTGYQGRAIQGVLLRDWSLLDYAARYSGLHLREFDNHLETSTTNLFQKLLSSHTLPNGGNFGVLVGTVWLTATQELIQTTEPLYFAASYGLASIVQLLVTDAAAVDLEAKGGRYGSSALQVAAYRGNTDCVRLLLEAGADPNSTNNLGETPLFWARQIGSTEIVELLRRYGAGTRMLPG